MRTKPLDLGPDENGVRVFLTGDRISFAGSGRPPHFPGARRLHAAACLLRSPEARVLGLGQGAFPDLQAIKLRGVGRLIVVEGIREGRLTYDQVQFLRYSGLRVVVVTPEQLAQDALHLSAISSLSRSLRFGRHLVAPPDEIKELNASNLEPVFVRCFGRPAGWDQVGAMGDVMAMETTTGKVRHLMVGGRPLVVDGEVQPIPIE